MVVRGRKIKDDSATRAPPSPSWPGLSRPFPRRPRVRTHEAGPLTGTRSAGVVATLGVRAHLRRRALAHMTETA